MRSPASVAGALAWGAAAAAGQLTAPESTQDAINRILEEREDDYGHLIAVNVLGGVCLYGAVGLAVWGSRKLLRKEREERAQMNTLAERQEAEWGSLAGLSFTGTIADMSRRGLGSRRGSTQRGPDSKLDEPADARDGGPMQQEDRRAGDSDEDAQEAAGASRGSLQGADRAAAACSSAGGPAAPEAAPEGAPEAGTPEGAPAPVET
eukprot:TRINITY_DN61421_c0_g1_i1.p1 TRINITY_DN61421_c0_g1~~TRINITY_DN61421_c0_g1_i1.p1  ORF type:complete len:227 (+),score=64.67 TRINITY_DN61421_c0_g1_i1:63-683(+)